jgi:hypothetical protein
MPRFHRVKSAPEGCLLAGAQIPLNLQFAGISRKHAEDGACLTLVEVGGSSESIPDLRRWIPLGRKQPAYL